MSNNIEKWHHRNQADINIAAKSWPNGEYMPFARDQCIGVCRIISNDSGGMYTVTRQFWDGQYWFDASKPAGFDDVDGRDYLNRSTGAANQYAIFWTQSASDGTVEILLDVSFTGISTIDVHSNTASDSPGPIAVTTSCSGPLPEQTMDLIIAHTALHSSQQNIAVRNSSGTGMITLKFDKYGHFIGT